MSDCIFESHQLWQSGFSRVYSNSFCSCSFEHKIIKIGGSSHKMYKNNSEFSRVFDNSECPYEKDRETYRMHLEYMYSSLWGESTCFNLFSFGMIGVCFKLTVTWTACLFVYEDISHCYFQGTILQISSDLLLGLVVCIDVCGSQIFISNSGD